MDTDSPAQPSPQPRVVKRYANRKLYDTVESRYVTLPQIAELVRQGEDVRIIDNNTKEDLTSMTLAQILYEEERKQSRASLPLATLKDLLHASGERILSVVRETPMAKVFGRSDPPEPDAPEAPPEPDAPADSPPEAREPGRVQQFVVQSREAIDQWQHSLDDRMRTFWEGINPAVQIQTLQAEVRRLQQRVDALEAAQKSRGGDGDLPTNGE